MNDAPNGTPTQWLADKVYRGLLGSVLALPYEQRLRTMGRIMSRVVAPLAGYQRRAEDQLGWIYPDMTKAEQHRIARAVADNTGRTLIELYSTHQFTARMGKTEIKGPGFEALKQAQAEGRAVLLLTGHYGNHLAASHALVARGYQVGGLYRPMKNPYFNAHYVKTLTEVSEPILPQGHDGTRAFLKHLSKGGMLTLLFDVWVGEGENIPFLGHPAPTSLAAATVAMRTKALLLPCFGTRLEDGVSFDVELEEPIEHSDPSTMMTEATKRLEARVRKNPEQWFWTHRRWKPERQKSSG